jgi:hypothetical protein
MELVFRKCQPNAVPEDGTSKTVEHKLGKLTLQFNLVYRDDKWAIILLASEADWSMRLSTPWYKTEKSTTELNRLFESEVRNATYYQLPFFSYVFKERDEQDDFMSRIWSFENFKAFGMFELTTAQDLATFCEISPLYFNACESLIRKFMVDSDFEEARDTLFQYMYAAFTTNFSMGSSTLPNRRYPDIDWFMELFREGFIFYMVNAVMVFAGKDIDLSLITEKEDIQRMVWNRSGHYRAVYPPVVDELFADIKPDYSGFKETGKQGYKRIPPVSHRDNNGVTVEPGTKSNRFIEPKPSDRELEREEQSALLILEKLFGESIAAELVRGKELTSITVEDAHFTDRNRMIEIDAVVKLRITK